MTNLKSWIQQEESKLKLLFVRFGHEIQTVLLPAAIKVTSALKAITDVDGVDVIGQLAGAAGPGVEEKIKAALPKVIADLQICLLYTSPSPRDS